MRAALYPSGVASFRWVADGSAAMTRGHRYDAGCLRTMTLDLSYDGMEKGRMVWGGRLEVWMADIY